ncbi:MAG TPA: hypothetical protein VGC13_00185 [Longimicrobium sp.]|uniref:hypothetical protein n=1 Tax=Longimicrobium sp. TaxID=2029185 RepID=UPI002ED835C3
MTHVRHVETQRSTITSVLLTLASAVLALAAVQWKNDERPHWSLGILLMLVGFVGLASVAKLYELYVEHKERARTFRKALAAKLPDARIEELKAEADERWKRDAPWLRPVPVHALWLGPHLFIMILGAVILVTTLRAVTG